MKVFLFVIATCLLGGTLSTPTDEIEPKQAALNYRLPNNVIPSDYDIEIAPFFTGPSAFTFNGIVSIIIRPINTTSEIALHQNQLTINEPLTTLSLLSNPGSRTVINNAVWDNETHIYTLYTATPLQGNVDYRLTFLYTGILSENMRGFYRSSYVENQVTKYNESQMT